MKPTKDDVLNYLHLLIIEEKNIVFKELLQIAYNIIKDTPDV